MELPTGPETVVHMLESASKQSPNMCAISYEDRELTYREYANCVSHFAQELVQLGVYGERVAILCSNSLDMAVAYFAGHAAGAQVVPINPAYTKRELVQILADAQPIVAIYDEDIKHLAHQTIHETGIEKGISVGPSALRLDTWKDKDRELSSNRLPTGDQLATLQYTGGTSGIPKGVNISHRQIAINLRQRESILPMRPNYEVILCVMPLFHIFASYMCLHTAAYCRGKLVIRRRYNPKDLLDDIESHKITILPVGPTVFHSLLNFDQFTEADFSNLRIGYSGSAPLPEETLQKWEKYTGTKILEGYGQSEAGPLLTTNTLDEPIIPGSVGRALPLTKIEIVDVQTGISIMDTGVEGEIRAKGPQIMLGYRNRRKETAEALKGGWLYTGDIGRLDENGVLYITDRKKDMAIVSGYNVYPREIDEVLFAHPNVIEAAAVGIPDLYRGEVIHAFVVVEDCTTNTVKELTEYCEGQMAKYKVPSVFHVVGELLKTTVGKIDKGGLRKSLIE